MDSKSFENLYNTYWEELYRYSFHYCKDRLSAEEIVQNVFLSLWQRKDVFEIGDDIRGYLYRAVKNQVFDFFRGKYREEMLISELQLKQCTNSCCTDNVVQFNELSQTLKQVVRDLPCRCREVYELSREKGLNNKQIALQLCISEKTVEQHMTKALRILRNKIKPRS